MVVTLRKIPIKTPYYNTKTYNLNSEQFYAIKQRLYRSNAKL